MSTSEKDTDSSLEMVHVMADTTVITTPPGDTCTSPTTEGSVGDTSSSCSTSDNVFEAAPGGENPYTDKQGSSSSTAPATAEIRSNNRSHGPLLEEAEDSDDGVDGSYARIVLVGMDGSAQSYHAFHWYISNMHMDGNYVVLVHAFELPLLASFQEMYVSADMWQATLKREARSTETMQKRLKGVLNRCKIPGRFEARGGRPGEVLVKVAEETGADVVIVGTRGHGKIRRAVLGSVSGYVTTHAPCPVMVCRQKGRCRTDSGTSVGSGVSGTRHRYDSTGSTGSRASSHVRFDVSETENEAAAAREAARRPRYYSAGCDDIKSEQRKKSTSLFKSIITRRRNKSESWADTPSGAKEAGNAAEKEDLVVKKKKKERRSSSGDKPQGVYMSVGRLISTPGLGSR